MIDNSIANPGRMGWGEEFQSIDRKVAKEREGFAKAYSMSPDKFKRKDARQPSEANIEKVRAEMRKDGIVDGFSCRYVEKAVFGTFLNWLAQIIGSCVASGNARIFTRRTLIESFLLGDPEQIFGTSLIGRDNVSIFAPYSYRAGRRRANMNRGDGSYCSVHIQGQMKDGVLPCSTPGIVSDSFPEPQDASLYRDWGNSNKLMDQFVKEARKYMLTESERVDSAEESKTLFREHMKPHMVCSMWAFRPDYAHPTWKLANGDPVIIYKRDRTTSWAHNMSIDGQVVIESNEEFTIVDNSWGMNAHRNGSWFTIPTELYDDWCRDSEQMTIGEIDLTDNTVPVAA